MTRISDAESQLMEILWRQGPTGGEDLIREATAAHGWSAGTVRTLIARLLQKKAIKSRKDGKSAIYHPLLKRADYVQAESETLLNKLFDGDVAPFVLQFAKKDRPLTAKDVEALKALIKRITHD
jgi:BlaI family transcriptional regulator, penicillinase repressor